MAEDDGQYVEDWSELSVAELREECKARGLDSSGKKDELVARLEASDAEAEEAEEGPESDGETPEAPAEEVPQADPAPAVTEQSRDTASLLQGDLTTYRASVPLPEDVNGIWDLEDADQQEMQLAARKAAEDAGLVPLGGAFCARLLGREGDMAIFEVPLSRTV